MLYLVLDACVLGEFFRQYLSSAHANRGYGSFSASADLSTDAANCLNDVLAESRDDLRVPVTKVVVTPLAVVELCRKWDQITNGEVDPSRIRAFLGQLPEWSVVASWDETLLPAFMKLPEFVYVAGKAAPIEWTDAIYPATAMAYGFGNVVITRDRRLIELAANMEGAFRCV